VSDTAQKAPETPEPQEKHRRLDVGVPPTWIPEIKVTLAAIVLALFVGAIMIIVSNPEVLNAWSYFFSYPWDAIRLSLEAVGNSYWALIKGAFGSWDSISRVLVSATPLICGGLGVSLAFRAGLFNIGAQGQLILGAIFCGYIGFTWSALPPGVHLLVAVIGALVGGAIWGGIAGWLKARTGAHEVITTIMLNYLALSLLSYLLKKNSFQVVGSNDSKSPPVDPDARFTDIGGLHIGFFVALLAAVVIWWLLNRTTIGFEMRAVGANPDAARTAGMSITKTYILVMVIAGALAGLAGAEKVLGHVDPLTDGIAGTTGFDSITVALLGRANPLGCVFAALLFGVLDVGGRAMQVQGYAQLTLTQVLSALIVLFVAAPALVRSVFHIKDDTGSGGMLAKGWGS
jgi:general nucleoside transport system permease protein